MDEPIMDNPGESLVARRSRRSTAGNRMEAALAEMALEITSNEVDDDKDFVNEKDEVDVFESDFESTDEEAAQEDADAGDKAVDEEDRRAKKANRSKLERATAAALAKHRVTFNPDAQAPTPTVKPRETKRRVSLGMAVNAETGEILQEEKGSPHKKKRHSQRRHTILNTSATVKRMKWSEEKKAATPKKIKMKSRAYTQAELIARALDNEEGNIVEHRDYLENEEEKRKRARVVRSAVEGPLLRWVSRGEEVKVIVPPPNTSFHPLPNSTYSYGSTSGFGTMPYGQDSPSYPSSTPGAPAVGTYLGAANYQPAPSTSNNSLAFPTFPPVKQPQFEATNYIPYSYQANASSALPLVPPQLVERTEKVAKNYIVHELSQYEGVPKAPWNVTMTAMFGDHVKWDELRVYVGRSRPLSRPKQMCPITGKHAKYLDPRTGVPYADLRAYEVLSGILRHEYIWSPSMGCYVSHSVQGEGVSNENDDTMAY